MVGKWKRKKEKNMVENILISPPFDPSNPQTFPAPCSVSQNKINSKDTPTVTWNVSF